ncbi:MAG TPA: helix-turn-helix transcriptional regulator [Bacteroidales bacterium]|nr:helix-turn-helix transcriptional regulator [Bacteroidales bacterium]
MNKHSIKERSKTVPADIKLLVKKSMATAKQIIKILESQGKTQRDLAVLLGKKESEISKWLQGTHNFTYKTICKIEVALGEPIIFTADQAVQNISFYRAIISSKTSQKICIEDKKKTLSTYNKQKPTVTSKSISNQGSNKVSISLLESCFNN